MTIGLRWSACTTPHEDAYVETFDKKTFRRSFANCEWKEALKKGHTLEAEKYPLGPRKEAQVPGEVPADVMEALERKDEFHATCCSLPKAIAF